MGVDYWQHLPRVHGMNRAISPSVTWARGDEPSGNPERTSALTTTPDIPSGLIFSNAAAREYGFTDEFWVEVCELYEKALANDPRKSFDVLDKERTIRRSFRGQPVDVLVRNHPDAREFKQLRFTAFLADANEDSPEIPRWYMDSDDRTVLGEAVLLDYAYDWK